MNKDLLMVVEAVSNEKAIARESIFEALESALEAVTRKKFSPEAQIYVRIDRKKGDFKTFRRWLIVEHQKNQETEISLEALLQSAEKKYQLGEMFEDEIPSIVFDRITTQQAKQLIIQKVREIERKLLAEKFAPQVGKLFSGVIKEVNREHFLVELSCGTEASLPRQELILKESFRNGDRVRAVLISAQWENPGPQLILSRVRNSMLAELLRIEVPEINDGTVEVKGIARIPGQRSKISVLAKDQRSDPIGACVGMRGSRIQAISSDLNGERLDIVVWDENPVQYVINAMAPTEVTSIIMDEDERKMDIAVSEETFAKAIGRNGQNVRLASQLTGWKLNILDEKTFKQQYAEESDQLRELLTQKLKISEEMASCLIDEGFTSLESIANLPEEEEDSVQEISPEEMQNLRQRAVQALIEQQQQMQAKLQEELQQCLPKDSFVVRVEVINQLLSLNLDDLEKIADASLEELTTISGLSEEQKGLLIMSAREKCWFKKETKNTE